MNLSPLVSLTGNLGPCLLMLSQQSSHLENLYASALAQTWHGSCLDHALPVQKGMESLQNQDLTLFRTTCIRSQEDS